MRASAVEWLDGKLRILDQSRLPWEQVAADADDYREVVRAIKDMRVRGAPAIGVAAAYGIALGASGIDTEDRGEFIDRLKEIMQDFAASRPTAVNLFRSITRMEGAARGDSVARMKAALVREAKQVHRDEMEATARLSRLGADLIRDGFRVLTHCNAGPLATAAHGTAHGVIKAASDQGKRISVLATETRPLLQGARLTAWELRQDGIPVTLITDSMAGHFMQRRQVDCVITGADRIAANGDVANKIGTYTLAVLARENGIPFYVAAPMSTVDLSIASGSEIPIEERGPEEVTRIRGAPIAAEGTGVANPSFDVTPHRYVAALITEKGVLTEPYGEALRSAGA